MFEEGLTIMANLGTEGFKKGTKEIEKAVKTMSTSVNRMSKQMTNGMKRFVTSLIGAGSVFSIISKGVSAFMSENEALSQRMSAIWTAVGNLLGPIITQIIDWVSTAVSYFLGFLKLLGVTGKSASELSTKATKATKELQRTLAGFDELNVLQDNSSSGGSGGTGQNPLQDLEPSEWMKRLAELLKNKMWDQAADMIVDKINEIIYKIRDKAYEAGQQIGEYLGGIIHIAARIIKDVDWHALGETIANFFNGLLQKIDGKDLGTLLVGKFVIAIGMLTGFLENLDWEQTAQFISDAVVGIFESLGEAIEKADFKKIGEGIRKFFGKLQENREEATQALYGFLKAVWEAALDLFNGLLGEAEKDHPIIASIRNLATSLQELADTISPIIDNLWHNYLQPFFEWLMDDILPTYLDHITSVINDVTAFLSGDIGLAEFIGRITGELAQFKIDLFESIDGFIEELTGMDIMEHVEALWENIKEAWASLKEWWRKTAFEDGKFCISGLFEGILEKLSDIGDWIKTNIFDPFVNGFKSVFKIASPSQVMKEIGGFILQGMIDGVTELLPNLDKIRDGITTAWTNLKDTVSGWWDSVKGWFTGADKTSESADGMETSLSNASTAATNSANAINEASGAYSQAYSAIATSAADAAKVVETNTTKIKDDTTTNFNAAAEAVSTSSEKMVTDTTTDFERMNTEVTRNADQMTNNVQTLIEQMKTNVLAHFDMLSLNANTIFNTLAANARIWALDMMSQFIGGINDMMPALVDTLIGVANTVNSYIGFSLPEKGPLADFDKSGPDMMDLFAEGMEGKTGRLVQALNDIAETVAFRAPGIAGGAILPYSVAAASGGGSGGLSDANALDVLERIKSELHDISYNMEHLQFVAQFGSIRAVAKEITRVQRQMSRAEGD